MSKKSHLKKQKKQRVRTLSKWQYYELRKREIATKARSCQEYETMIYNLCKEIGI